MSENNGWLPIETAPKDKTRVLIARPGEGPIIAKQSGMGVWINCFPTRSLDRVLEGEAAPTHWQPLPPPPETHTQEA